MFSTKVYRKENEFSQNGQILKGFWNSSHFRGVLNVVAYKNYQVIREILILLLLLIQTLQFNPGGRQWNDPKS